MKICFLDDDPKRQRKRFWAKGEDDLRQVWNASDCIEALKEGGWQIVSLDHDLRNIPYDDPNIDNCGSAVVRWIVENKPDVEKFIVHSYNWCQAPTMVQNLLDAGYKCEYIPFNL